jgi:ATP-dependent RNA helicase RhlE
MPFAKLNLNESILRALKDEGYETPTAIQAKAIPPILEGRDLLGCAQTGTGKTAAFALPIIHRLIESVPHDAAHPAVAPRSGKSPRALILSPTRELAAQIGESFAAYGRHAGLRGAVIFGGVSQHHQERALAKGVDVVVATPGRLMDLMEQGIVDLSKIAIFVLDEADRMLDMGFIQPIRRIAAAVPKTRQTLLFSATMPKEIQHLADSLLREPVKVAVHAVASAAPKIEQQLYYAHARQKQALLERLLESPDVQRALVFTRTKHGADRVCKRLNHDNIPAIAIHGNKAQNYRLRALDAFRSGKARVLVATDVAARGLDVDGITHVFNFDLPMEPEAYVHRIGRTGRAGASGIAISFCDSGEREQLRQIQRLTGGTIPVIDLPTDLPLAEPSHPHSTRDTGPRPMRGPAAARAAQQREQRPQRRTQRGHAQGASHGQGPSHAHGSSGQPRRDAGPGGHGHSTEGRPARRGHVESASGGEGRPAPAPKGQQGGGGHSGAKPQVRVFGPRKGAKPARRW